MPSKTRIAIIGVGLLGGSLALALKRQKGLGMVGWNHRASSRRKASHLLPVAPTFEKAIEGADIVVLCSHSSSIGPVLKQMAPLIKLDTLILDVSSVKGEVVRVAQSISGMAKHFVPCHPMAGKEKSGPGNADPRLYQGKFVFITPLSMTPASLVQRASQFWKKVGAVPIVTTAPIHDRSVALTSHLPHLLASAFMELYGRHHGRSPVFRKALGSGFRDFTRIAASHPAMWRDIMEMNAGEIKLFLTQYRHLLAKLEKNLARDKGSFWLSFFKKARMLREKI